MSPSLNCKSSSQNALPEALRGPPGPRGATRRQERPRRASRAPRRGPGAARSHPKIVLNPLWPPKSQERPGRGPGATPEASWKRFWSLQSIIWEVFESFLGVPGTSFSTFFGAVQGRCAYCHCVLQMLGRRVPALALTISTPCLSIFTHDH